MIIQILFWLFLALLFYAYLGYTLLLLLPARLRRTDRTSGMGADTGYEPLVSLIIPAYNEEDFVIEKMENTQALDYPAEKLKIIWITDGCTDLTHELLSRYERITLLYESERKGKIHAMNRGIKSTDTPIVLFTDANTMLNQQAIREMVRPFSNKLVGCVAGEKRILAKQAEKAVGAGEGLYWKYESWIKTLESETGSSVGAVGELFAVRRELFPEVREDTLLDDLTISLHIAGQGYMVKYAPGAWGVETASVSVSEEMKRKVRIAAGGLQLLFRMGPLLNPFRYGLLSIKYISHKVLRWTIVPFCFPLILLFNIVLVGQPVHARIYSALLILQVLFYTLVAAGALLHNVRLRLKALFMPYYLLTMNYAIAVGMVRFITGKYSVKWQKVKRS